MSTAPTTGQPPVSGLPHAPVPRGAAASQATVIEGQRAAAEVFGAILAAQQVPRIVSQAIAQMEESCQIPELASRAFWSFPRSGQPLQGPSIQLARELARCWGNLDYGIKELSRDDAAGVSEMLAFAWDLQTNTRVTTTFIVPHIRDKKERGSGKSTPERLTDMRDIYENNANLGSRRVREMIFSVLPTWYTTRAQSICRWANEHGGGRPLAERVATTLRVFGDLGVPKARLEARVGMPATEWTGQEVVALDVIAEAIRGGEATALEEFPREGGQITEPTQLRPGKARQPEPAAAPAEGQGAGEPVAPAAAAPPAATRPTGRPAGRGQIAALHGLFADAGFRGNDAKLLVCSTLAGVPVLGHLSQLTTADATKVTTKLKGWQAEGAERLQAEVAALVPDEGAAVWATVDAARQAYEAVMGADD